MKSFLRENGYGMVKLFLNQIVITVFALMLSMATLSNRKLSLAVSIFSILFFLYLNYSQCWEIGAKDKLKIDGGRMGNKPLTGLWLALGANVPNIISALLIGLGAILDTKFGQSMSMICDIISRFLNNMYFGVMNFLEYAIYRNPSVSKAVEILNDTELTAETVKALTLIDDPNYTIHSITQAIDALENAGTPSSAVEALDLLKNAAHSPQIIENWWWFLVITIPSLLVCFTAYRFGANNFRILSVFGITPSTKGKK